MGVLLAVYPNSRLNRTKVDITLPLLSSKDYYLKRWKKHEDKLVILVHAQQRYVVMENEKYDRLRELALAATIAETRADYAAGRYTQKRWLNICSA